MLTFYALYKQAINGPCNISRPYMWDAVGRAKWYGPCKFSVYLCIKYGQVYFIFLQEKKEHIAWLYTNIRYL